MFGEGEKYLRGGALSLLFPSPARKLLVSYSDTGWRGVRGEVKVIEQVQVKPGTEGM